MKKIIYILVSFSFFGVSAQIGVNTNTPVEEVHIAGNSSTVRVEGLNAANNILNNGIQGNTRVFVNSSGDLVLGAKENNLAILFDPVDYLKSDEGSNSSFTQNGTGSGYQIVGEPNAYGEGLSQFTLTRNAILELNYAFTWRLRKNDSFQLSDGAARIVQSYIILYKWDLLGNPVGAVNTDLDGNSVSLLGLSGQYYSNRLNNNGAEQLFHNNGTDFVKLGPGIYRPLFAVQVAVSNTMGVGAIKFYIGGGQDEMQVIAHYYN